MILGIADDFTSNAVLDADLTNPPTSGLFLNSGVHPSITIDNLLSFLPALDADIANWNEFLQYAPFDKSRKRSDIVRKNNKLYQCILTNTGKDPENEITYWRETNVESLSIKTFIYKVQDRFLADLHLTKMLINNQYLYEDAPIDRPMTSLPVDYVGWTFEAKGSDYTTIVINQGSIQKSGTTPMTLYIVHENELINTIQLTPKDGMVSFQPISYSFPGTGRWRIVFESTDVYTSNGWIDPLKYDGFVCYGCVGMGNSPETAKYSISNRPFGLGFNVSVFLDSKVYIENNLSYFGAFIRATFEYMAFQMFYSNSNSRLNLEQRNARFNVNLEAEIKDINSDTAVKRYNDEKKRAMKVLQKTFDTQLDTNELEISISSV